MKLKQLQNIFHVNVNAISIISHITICNSKQNGIINYVNANGKIIVSAKKIIVGILAHAFVRIASI